MDDSYYDQFMWEDMNGDRRGLPEPLEFRYPVERDEYYDQFVHEETFWGRLIPR